MDSTPHPLTGQGPALAAVAAGGAVGSLARYGIGLGLPSPWSTLAINVTGCLLIGVLLVALTERRSAHPLLRPFLATGVLGGYTTFSTYTVDVHLLLGAGRFVEAVAYLVGTLVAALAATWFGVRITRAVLR